MLPPSLTEEQIFQFDTYLFDADGVLWCVNKPIPGANKFINELINRGKNVFIVTNNAAHTTSHYVEKLHKLGFGNITESNIISPNIVLIDYLKRHPQYIEKNIYAIATTSTAKMIKDATGAECIGLGPDAPAEDALMVYDVDISTEVSAVVVGYDPHFSYPKMIKATNYLNNPDVGFFITNEDYHFPSPNPKLIIPGNGCMSIAIRAAVPDREPLVFGKPSGMLTEYLVNTFNLNPEKTIMFGDRLDTDVKFGNDSGFVSCWMQTGTHKKEDVVKASNGADPSLIPQFTYSFHIHE